MTEQPSRLEDAIEANDVVWLVIPLSKAEIRRLAPHKGYLTGHGTYWAEIREGMGLQETPYNFQKGTHVAIHQGPRPWLVVDEVLISRGEVSDAGDDAGGGDPQGSRD